MRSKSGRASPVRIATSTLSSFALSPHRPRPIFAEFEQSPRIHRRIECGGRVHKERRIFLINGRTAGQVATINQPTFERWEKPQRADAFAASRYLIGDKGEGEPLFTLAAGSDEMTAVIVADARYIEERCVPCDGSFE